MALSLWRSHFSIEPTVFKIASPNWSMRMKATTSRDLHPFILLCATCYESLTVSTHRTVTNTAFCFCPYDISLEDVPAPLVSLLRFACCVLHELSVLYKYHSEAPNVCVCVCMLVAQSCPILCDPMGCIPPGFLCPWIFPGKNTGVGCHSLLQAPHMRWYSYLLLMSGVSKLWLWVWIWCTTCNCK